MANSMFHEKRMLPFVLLCCLVLPTLGNDLTEFSRDTVLEGDSVVLHNLSGDTVIVDTIIMLMDTSGMRDAEINFFVGEENGVTGIGYQLWIEFGDFGRAVNPLGREPSFPVLRIPPGDSIHLKRFAIDLCLACPLSGSPSTTGEWEVGDSIWAILLFKGSPNIDTLTVGGIRSVGSTGIRRAAPSGLASAVLFRSQFEYQAAKRFMLNGRAINEMVTPKFSRGPRMFRRGCPRGLGELGTTLLFYQGECHD